MREIKFRGYSKYNNTWYYGLIGKFDGKYYIECEGGVKPFVEEDSIGQFTGFKDKNGKKIYGGDIVKYEIYDEMDTYIHQAEVYFDDELGMWMAHEERVEEVNGDIQLHSMNGKVEVIGNTYEEKLKEDK